MWLFWPWLFSEMDWTDNLYWEPLWNPIPSKNQLPDYLKYPLVEHLEFLVSIIMPLDPWSIYGIMADSFMHLYSSSLSWGLALVIKIRQIFHFCSIIFWECCSFKTQVMPTCHGNNLHCQACFINLWTFTEKSSDGPYCVSDHHRCDLFEICSVWNNRYSLRVAPRPQGLNGVWHNQKPIPSCFIGHQQKGLSLPSA